ncbi:unnamed protein product [Mytilus coruscus]|uniref:Mab-21-like nucleotidyltransferase domain-containing protein n=1 Tax=Mytilus coruscus TaxID=42192 RepID=A0A6J8CTI8_MYTCO|nr:unnamed protein product [Mytilus coruscus]
METDKNICRRLYHCLCETIGSEEVVQARRQFYASVDHFAERKEFTLISSGSRAAGLEMGSDVDVMCLLKFVNVSEERTDDSFLIPNNFVMEMDDCKPCFTKLKGNSCHYNLLTHWFSTPLGQGLSLESGRIRYLLLSIIRLFKPMILHGPCASDNDVDVTSGSRAEGLEMQSDIDVMGLFRLVNVSEKRTDDSFLIPNNFVMDTDDCKPCFTQLKGNSCHYDALVNWLSTPYGQELRFESGRIRHWIVSIVGLFRPVTLHGPCALDMNELEGFLDITVCLRCPVFIQQAQPWIKRERFFLRNWFQMDAVTECTNGKLFNVICTLTSSNISTIEKEGIRQKIWKRRHVYKHHVVNEISFYYNSRVIPPELDVQATTLAYIPSRVYIQFLRFLCLYRLQEHFQCMQAVDDLRISVSRTHLEDMECALGEAYHCLVTALIIFD